MAKINGAKLKRHRQIEIYKKIIIYGFLYMTIFLILTSVFLLYKINKLEKQVDYALSENSGVFTDSEKAVLGSPRVGSNGTKNTQDKLRGGNDIREVNADTIKKDENGQVAEDFPETDSETKKQVKGRVYLTFDDGPSVYTGELLDILKENNVKATFFVIGREPEYYEYYKRMVDEGHTIGMHSYTHQYDDFYKSVQSFGEELTKLDKLIYDVTGVHSKVFRFPGGSSNSVAPLPAQDYIAYLNEHNINYYDWNALNGDAVTTGLSPQTLVDNIMNDVSKNEDSIVLMHDLQTTHTTVESLQILIDTLRSEGYELLPIDGNTPLIQHVSCNCVEE